jgi:hypothetical protein
MISLGVFGVYFAFGRLFLRIFIGRISTPALQAGGKVRITHDNNPRILAAIDFYNISTTFCDSPAKTI